MLVGLRVLEVGGGPAAVCGKMLADLGAEVIKVEPPGGEAARRVGPFVRDREGDDDSLSWIAYNTDKQSITLDLAAPDGQVLFRRLVAGSALVVDALEAGQMARWGLDGASLRRERPALVTTSITPFGQTGPYSRYKADDLVVMSMAGHVQITGDADRRPLNISLPQAPMLAGADAAVGSLIALRHARRRGVGQHVDISMQHSAAWFLGTMVPYQELAGVRGQRIGTLRGGGSSGARQRQVWPCRDGHVFFFMIGGQQGAKTCRELVRWMADEGQDDPVLQSFDWESFDMASASQELIDRLSDPLAAFFATRTKKQVLDAAVGRGISVCPLLSMGDLLDDASLNARDFWMRLPHPALPEGLHYPTRYVRASASETGTVSPPPRVGEHNAAVHAELGLSDGEIGRLRGAGVV